jgi:hypothetical protein
MIDRRQEISEFDARLTEMQERLASRGVVIEKKDYAAEAFGSWQVIAGTAKKKFDFTYDGKDSYLMYRDAAVVPKDYRDFEHKRFRTWEGEDPLAYLEQVLTREFSSP